MTHPTIRPTGPCLFSFVVVADTHVNESEDRSLSPFAMNRLSNARARFVMAEIAALQPQPQFIVHLGDIVHPLPSLPTYDAAVNEYKQIAKLVDKPIYLVPGNHDIGEKTVDWVPADVICDKHIAKYREAFGADYYSFTFEGLIGIVINAQLLNSQLPAEEVQRKWLEQELETHAGQRIFMFMHYPLYLHTADERSIYDSIDQPGRAWLLRLVRQYKMEGVFAGHVHNFWYDIHDQTQMYLLPSTAFLRHDYAEFSRMAPSGDDFGRSDFPKFGYCVVDIHTNGHAVRLYRTNGRTLAPGEASLYRPRAFAPLNVKTKAARGVGVELRHAWAEVTQIASTGGVQEFGRKLARNDYPVMALWEMGTGLLKVPDQDFTDPYVRERVKVMRELGHQFIATVLGVPRPELLATLNTQPELVDMLEINLSGKKLSSSLGMLARLRESLGRPLLWAKLRMQEDQHFDGAHFSHSVMSGLYVGELARHADQFAEPAFRHAFDGVVVRVDRGEDLIGQAELLEEFARTHDLSILASIKLGDASLARMRNDDHDTALLAAQAVLVGAASSRVTYVFDTFMDVDRGYHPRNGFIDRNFNPRAALRAFATITSLVHNAEVSFAQAVSRGSERVIEFTVAGKHCLIAAGLDARQLLELQSELPTHRAVDLLTGEVMQPLTSMGAEATSPSLILLEGY